jgi:hypothetical protein
MSRGRVLRTPKGTSGMQSFFGGGSHAQEEGRRYDDPFSGLVTGTRRIRLVACSSVVAILGVRRTAGFGGTGAGWRLSVP